MNSSLNTGSNRQASSKLGIGNSAISLTRLGVCAELAVLPVNSLSERDLQVLFRPDICYLPPVLKREILVYQVPCTLDAHIAEIAAITRNVSDKSITRTELDF
jgi:hypothetical protein